MIEPTTRATFRQVKEMFQFQKKDALAYTKRLRASYEDGEPVSPEDFDFLLLLLRTHPQWRKKTKSGVVGFEVNTREIAGVKTRCFFYTDELGQKHDFSFYKSLNNVFKGSLIK